MQQYSSNRMIAVAASHGEPQASSASAPGCRRCPHRGHGGPCFEATLLPAHRWAAGCGSRMWFEGTRATPAGR